MRRNRIFNWLLWIFSSILVSIAVLAIEYILFGRPDIEWSSTNKHNNWALVSVVVFTIAGLFLAWRKGGSIRDNMGGNFNLFFNEEEYWEKWGVAQLFQVGAALLAILSVLVIDLMFSL